MVCFSSYDWPANSVFLNRFSFSRPAGNATMTACKQEETKNKIINGGHSALHYGTRDAFFFTSRYSCPNRNRALALCSAQTKNYAHAFSQRGVGGHTEILRTYVEIYVGCNKDDVMQSIEKGDLKS